MKVKLLYTIFFYTLLLSSGCVKESVLAPPKGDDATLSLKIPMGVNVPDNHEDKIKNVRVLSFYPQQDARFPGRLDVNCGVQAMPTTTDTITLLLPEGNRDIYVFANETILPQQTIEQLSRLSRLSDLAGIKIPHTPRPPFFSSFTENVNIQKEPKTKIKAQVLRSVSKISLTLKYTWGPNTPRPQKFIFDRVQVKHLPTFSYLIAKAYDSTDYTDSETLSGINIFENKSETPESSYLSDTLTLYFPEFIGTNADNHSYVEIVGHLESDNSAIRTYTIPLGLGMKTVDGKLTVTDYTIPRNHEFGIDATINSYNEGGSNDDVLIKISIQPWKTTPIEEGVGHYITFTKASLDGELVENEANIKLEGGKIKIHCKTDIGGWYTVARDIFNKLIHRGMPLPRVNEHTEDQFDEIQIPSFNENLLSQAYTIGIYHPVHAPESFGPLKLFTVYQIGDLIPNSVLEAAGWPASPRRRKGILIAKRGNIIDEQAPLVNDLTQCWSKDKYIKVTTQLVLGSGYDNTENIASKATSPLTAALFCKNLGEGWYLPSEKELMFLFNYGVNLKPIFAFNSGNYWSSSSEPQGRYSYYVNSYTASNGSSFSESYDKTNKYRCIKDV